MTQKTIVIDVRMLNNSGIGVYIEYLVGGLISAKKYKIILIGNENDINAKFNTNGIYRVINVELPIYSLKEQFYLPFIIPKCDIFWSPHYNIPLLPIVAKKRIVTIHDTYHLAYSKTLNIFKVLYAKILLNSAVRLSEVVLTDSEFSKSEIIKFTNSIADKINILYVGIDTDRFIKVLSETSKIALAQRLQLPDKFLLFVGNVKPNKNLSKLLDAFLTTIKDHPEFNLVIVGKKEGFITGDKEVYKLIEQNELLKSHVYFTGYVAVNDLPLIYNLATLLVFPSIYEGFGLPPLEAMACECPVVVSSVASMPEVCGNAGYYINPFESVSISEGIDQVISNDKIRDNLIKLGKARAKEFDWPTIIVKFISIIDTI